eukprot:1333813-Rhodomonas_salina.1
MQPPYHPRHLLCESTIILGICYAMSVTPIPDHRHSSTVAAHSSSTQYLAIELLGDSHARFHSSIYNGCYERFNRL